MSVSALCRRPLAEMMLATILCCTGSPALGGEAGPVEPPPAATPAPESSPAADITARSQEALNTLDRLRSEIAALDDGEVVAASVEELGVKVDDLLPEGQSLEDLMDKPALIDGVLVRSKRLSQQAGVLIEELTGEAEELEKRLSEIRALIAAWEGTLAEGTELPEALSARIDDILSNARLLEKQINGKLNKVIELQNATMGVRNVITPIAERIDSYGRSRQLQIFERNTAPIWQLSRDNISRSSERSSRRLVDNLQRDFASWSESSETAIGAHLLLLPLILFLLIRLKRMAEHPSSALARPIPTGVLIWMLLGVVIYAGAPQVVRMIFVMAGMLVAAVVLLNFLPRQMRPGVLIFVAIALVHEFFQGLIVTEDLPRVVYLVLAVALGVLTRLSRRQGIVEPIVEWGAPRSLMVAAVNGGTFLLAVSVLANVLGYVALAKLLMQGVLDSIAVFLILFAGFSSINEIVQVVLKLPALDHVRSIAANRYRLQRTLRKPLVWLSLLLWIWATLYGFGVDDWFLGSAQRIIQAELTVGEITLSLRGVIVFVLAVWLAVWASRIVRAVLNQDVLPRMDLPRGVPNTISMTAHYSIILIGLLLGVGFMGLDLSSLAFVVGALGVGIGFGLQNLVNNFVSGLILIFEAPIQVGDTVEVGNLMGRVTQIGIRTSRVRTYSGSEVIVPNGDLISNQVINWTLSDRRRRLELPVGVAYGSDPDRVTAVLRAVVEEDEGVLAEPAPMVVFTEFGDSALIFKIYAWIADFDTGFSMTHRLNSAISAALEEAGIEIPFPQRDLHLKSLPEGFAPGG